MALFRVLRRPIFLLRKELLSTTPVKQDQVEERNAKPPKGIITKTKDNKDRSEVISVETSLEYMKSDAYKETYGDLPVWTHYVRNFKGHIVPDTRRNCITNNRLNNSSPCPICRDVYLVVDYRNLDLIKQFVSPLGGEIIKSLKTGVCQHQHKQIQIAIQKAKNYGFLTYHVPHREYDYSLYHKE